MNKTGSSYEKKEQIQEKINKLFTDAIQNALQSFYQKYSIITKPNAIWDLLILFDNLEEDNQSYVIEQLRNNIERYSQNSLTLVTKTIKKLPNHKTENVLEFLIKLILKFCESRPNISKELITLVTALYKYNTLKKSHLNIIYSYLSEKFYSNTINGDILQLCTQLLLEMFSLQTPLNDEPQNFFFFSGENSGIFGSQESYNTWPFSNGFSIGIWFYIDESMQALRENNETLEIIKLPKLFTIYSSGNGGIEAYFVGKHLFYRILSQNYTNPTVTTNGWLIGKFKTNTWYYLGLDHEKAKSPAKPSQLQIVLNNELVNNISIELPKISKEDPLTTINFGEGLLGKISSIILFKEPVGYMKLAEVYSFYNYGIQQNAHIKNLNLSLQSVLENALLLYTPIRAIEDKCHDIFSGIIGLMGEHTGFIYKDFNKIKLTHLGGISAMLPLYYLLRFCDSEKNPKLLNNILQLTIVLLKNKPENQNEAAKMNFFKIIGHLLSENLTNFFNVETVEIISELRSCISDPKLLQEIFVNFIWKIDIYQESNQEVKNAIWAFIRGIYLQNFTIKNYTCLSLFGIQDILDLAIDRFDNKLLRCCQRHAKLLSPDEIHSDIKQEVIQNATPLINIIEAILTSGGDFVSKGILAISNTFTLKCSPCFHMLLFKMLERILIEDNAVASTYFIKPLIENKTIQNILCLLVYTPCVDLKAICIKFLNILISYPQNTMNENEIALYLSNILYSSDESTKTMNTEEDTSKLITKNEDVPQTTRASTANEIPTKCELFVPAKKNPLPNRNVSLDFLGKPVPLDISEPSTSTTTEKKVSIGLDINDPEKQLEVMSKNLKNSSVKLGASKGFDFTKKSHIQVSNYEEVKNLIDTRDNNLILGVPPFKKKMGQNISKTTTNLKLADEEILKKEDNPSQTLLQPIEKAKKRPKMLDLGDDNRALPEKEICDNINTNTDEIKELEIPKTSGKICGSTSTTLFETKLEVDKLLINPVPKKTIKKANFFDQANKKELKYSKSEANSDSEKAEEPHPPKLIMSSSKLPLKRKILAMPLAIDIETVNEDYTFGGEQGKKKPQDIDKYMDIIMQEVAEMAKECVLYMKGKKINQTGDIFDQKMPNITPFNENTSSPSINTPKSVRGVKKIDFSSVSKSSKPALEIIKENNNSGLLGEDSSLSTSLDQSTEKNGVEIIDIKSLGLNERESIDKPTGDKDSVRNILSSLDHETNDMEPLYNSLLEWLLHKQPKSLERAINFDANDKICSTNVIYIIMKLYRYSNQEIKHKIINDMHMLAKSNQVNCNSLLGIPEFYLFLLDILYQLQLLYYEEDLQGANLAIWEIGTKLHTVLMKHIISYENDGHKKLQNLFIWMENKTSKSIDKSCMNRQEKAAHYLIRHLWNELIQSINDLCYSSRPALSTLFWKNVIYIVFFTQEIVSSAYVNSNKKTPIIDSKDQNICSLRNYFFIKNIDEEFPYNFKQVYEESNWTDSILISNLFRILEPLWADSIFTYTGATTSQTESQKLDKKLNTLLDVSNSEDYHKDLEIFLNEPYQAQSQKRGTFLKNCIVLLTAYIEDCIKNSKLENIKIALQRLSRIFKFSMVVFENARDLSFQTYTQGAIISNYVYIYNFLYNILGTTTNEIFKNELKSCLKHISIFMLAIIDFLDTRYGTFTNTEEGRLILPFTSSLLQAQYNLVVFDMFQTYLNEEEEPLISSNQIKTLKNKEYKDIESIIYSKQWMYAFLDNPKVLALIEKYYGEYYINTNSSILKNIQRLESIETQGKLSNEKLRDEITHKYETELYNSITKIHESKKLDREKNIAIDEENARISRNLWRKIWKRLRAHNGQWKHPDFYDQCDKKFPSDIDTYEKMPENNLFVHKISKFETKIRSRPFLKILLTEPLHVSEYLKNLKLKRAKTFNMKNSLNLALSTVYKSQQQEQNKPFSLLNIGKNIKNTLKFIMPTSQINSDKGLNAGPSSSEIIEQQLSLKHENLFLYIKDEVFLTKKCQWIKALIIRNGSLQITSNKLIFIIENSDQKDNQTPFLNSKLSDDQRLFKEWPLEYIKEIQKRKYVLRKSALEIFLVDGSTLLFNFPEGDQEEVSSKLIRMRKQRCQNLNYCGTLEPRKLVDKSGITKRWMNHEISNFEYLMYLNSQGGRSFKDLTQYPVFPWILSDYINDTLNLNESSVFRDLSKSMGALGNEERTNAFLQRYETVDPFNPVPKFHFGSHYSSPAIILQYLLRINPYTLGAKHLQSGAFDLSDRLFSDIGETYKRATEEISDVRELLPEFFYLPEMLINIDKLDFGIKQNGVRVHHVGLPEWAKGNPYRFTCKLRQALEHDWVSQTIHNWIDLIFGYKQRGKEAEKSLNTYYFLTYEDSIDIEKIADRNLKISTEAQVIHFGQCPTQLFLKPHSQKNPKHSLVNYRLLGDPEANIRAYRPVNKKPPKQSIDRHSLNVFGLQDRALVKLKLVLENKIAGFRKDGTVTYFHWSKLTVNQNTPPFTCGIEKEKKIQIERPKCEPYFEIIDRSANYNSYPMVFLSMAKIVISGGYWDGRLIMHSIDTDDVMETYTIHNDTITAIVADPKENFIITGSKSGDCILWKISPEQNKLSMKFHLYDHDDTITSIYISGDLKLFATASLDGKVNIYHLVIGKLMRTIYHPSNLPINIVVLTSSPLPAVIFFSNEDKLLYSYSINGRLLESIGDDSAHVISPLITRDLNFNEILIYGNEKGEIFVRELPFLNFRKKFPVSAGSPVLSILITKDKRFLLCGCGDGEIAVLCDPNYLQNTSNNIIGSKPTNTIAETQKKYRAATFTVETCQKTQTHQFFFKQCM